MPQSRGFFDYMRAAFSARPFGMFVAPNWVGVASFALLGLVNPGFWVLGGGLELGYLAVLSTNRRFQRTVDASNLSGCCRDWATAIAGGTTRWPCAARASSISRRRVKSRRSRRRAKASDA
jgi:hypothetical protein